MTWIKSSYSLDRDCVEVNFCDDGAVNMRNSKDPNGPALTFTPEEWDAFLLGAKDGEFD